MKKMRLPNEPQQWRVEADGIAQVKDYLKFFLARGLYYRRNIGGLSGQSNRLDFDIWWPPGAVAGTLGPEGRGYFMALECKGVKGKVTPGQLREIEALRRAGHRAEVVRSLDEVMALLPHPNLKLKEES